MQTFIDLINNQEYHFDDGVNVDDFTPDGVTLTVTPSSRPTPHHDLVGGQWDLVRMDDLRDDIWGLVKNKRSVIMRGGVIFNADTFQSRAIDMNIAQAAITSNTTWPKNRPAMDNTSVSLSKADATAILTLIIDLYEASDINAQSLRDDITSSEDPLSVNIDVGWPAVPFTGA